MPQVLIAAAVIVVGYCAYRLVKREIGRVGAELDKQRRAGGPKPAETLERDPESGRYRPQRND